MTSATGRCPETSVNTCSGSMWQSKRYALLEMSGGGTDNARGLISHIQPQVQCSYICTLLHQCLSHQKLTKKTCERSYRTFHDPEVGLSLYFMCAMCRLTRSTWDKEHVRGSWTGGSRGCRAAMKWPATPEKSDYPPHHAMSGLKLC